MSRAALAALALGASLASSAVALAATPTPTQTIAVDRDDDDLDGRPDAEQPRLPRAILPKLARVEPSLVGKRVTALSGGEHLRLLGADGVVLGWGDMIPKDARLQGRSVGRVVLAASGGDSVTIDVVGVGFRDGTGHELDLATERASLERLPPDRAPASAGATYDDPDALRARVELPPGGVVDPHGVTVESVGVSGASIDTLEGVALERVRCAGDAECFASAPLRFVVDDADRTHPLVEKRSVRAEVGGAIVLRYAGASQSIRVEGPRSTPLGPLPRLRAHVRPFVIRTGPRGAPAIGGNDAGAIAAVRTEIASASATWGQCGITFGDAARLPVTVVDPPPSWLVSFGDDLGLVGGGGSVKVKIDGKPVTSAITAGQSPLGAARVFAKEAEKAGFSATLSSNVRIVPAANGSVDVLLRKDKMLAHVEPASGSKVTDDPSMNVRIGVVDLSDGLFHFGDMDSMSGTLEERTLLKSFDDGDPTTIELVFIPRFTMGDRIGESFIQNDTSSVRNLVLLDRAGVRARRMSSTLAHEIGHVLMNAPGHPDDYGLDTPTRLMDSDGADASPFGPRRLTIEECVRAIEEAGPTARVPLLAPWPLTPLVQPTRSK